MGVWCVLFLKRRVFGTFGTLWEELQATLDKLPEVKSEMRHFF